MSDSISAIQDDYDDYEYLCKKIGVTPVGLYSTRSFYDDEKRIEAIHDYLKTLPNWLFKLIVWIKTK